MERRDPEHAKRLYNCSLALRGALAILTCLLGFVAGDFSTFLNLQGALVGTLISYVLPCLFFLRVTTYVRAMRYTAQMPASTTEVDNNNEDQEARNQDEDKEKLLEDIITEEDIEKEPAHVSTDKLAEETYIERLQRYLCYIMIIFGFSGGIMSFLFTSTTILNDFV